jgi:hypothetical protein
MKRTLLALGLFSAAAIPFAASAGGLDIGVGINLGGPRVYAPPPVVYAEPAAPVVYEQPEVVYAPPPPTVVYTPPAVVYSPYHCWWEYGYRVCR